MKKYLGIAIVILPWGITIALVPYMQRCAVLMLLILFIMYSCAFLGKLLVEKRGKRF